MHGLQRKQKEGIRFYSMVWNFLFLLDWVICVFVNICQLESHNLSTTTHSAKLSKGACISLIEISKSMYSSSKFRFRYFKSPPILIRVFFNIFGCIWKRLINIQGEKAMSLWLILAFNLILVFVTHWWARLLN